MQCKLALYNSAEGVHSTYTAQTRRKFPRQIVVEVCDK